MLKTAAVITTIQPPTPSVRQWAKRLSSLIVIGDRKGPDAYDLDGAAFHSLADQLRLSFDLASRLPIDHYARKNIGYMLAMQQQPDVIYETDDDNAPMDAWAAPPRLREAGNVSDPGWCNVYRLFSDERVWPRGLPLARVNDNPQQPDAPATYDCPVQQGLADGSPDVDAVWRIACDKTITFARRDPVRLAPGVWCPFNSQNTWWFREAWPLMYLPSHCTMRMTDIWRGFVAQRCLWAMDYGLLFHSADVYQDRNKHDLVSDMESELPGYRHNHTIARHLADLDLSTQPAAVCDNLRKCYQQLIAGGFIAPAEMELVHAWLSDLTGLGVIGS